MDEEAKSIRLPEGIVERSLGGLLALCMGVALSGAVVGVSGFAASGIVETIIKIVAAEFVAMLALYCLLVVVWCVCRPSWVQHTVNKVMKNFFPLVIVMSVGALFFLIVSLALA
jgi:hypothetical protein